VSRSRFYDWRFRPESATAKRRELLKIKIKVLVETDAETYGYRRIQAALARGGEQASDEPVRQLMREMSLGSSQPTRRRLSTVRGEAGPIPDLLDRDFSADKPGKKMAGDVTYIFTWEGWLYLATVIDCTTTKGGRMDDGR
jgi:putative transposase